VPRTVLVLCLISNNPFGNWRNPGRSTRRSRTKGENRRSRFGGGNALHDELGADPRHDCCILFGLFNWASNLWNRLSSSRRRANEVREVRCRLAEQPDCGVASPAEVRIARRLRTLREEMSAQVGVVEACKHCVRPRSPAWPGGHCCSGNTQDRFTGCELGALKLSGTTPRDLRPPRSAHAGCAFRSPQGCSLKVAHRPFLCVSYLCGELRSELEKRGDGPSITRLKAELHREFDRFVETRNNRIASTEFNALEASLSSNPDRRIGRPLTRP